MEGLSAKDAVSNAFYKEPIVRELLRLILTSTFSVPAAVCWLYPKKKHEQQAKLQAAIDCNFCHHGKTGRRDWESCPAWCDFLG